MSEEVYEYLQGLAEPSAEELQMIEDELGWLDFIESLLEGLTSEPVSGSERLEA